MLSRIANSLLWMGRYLERAEHTARYLHTHYFSALDAPTLSRKDFILNSVSSMTGLKYEFPEENALKDSELIYMITLDESNPVSIMYSICKARENARGARDILSSELWESVNKFYHQVMEFQDMVLTEETILSFTEMVVDNCAIVNGYIHKSLIHDNTFYMIKLGMHIEAAGQISRILISKVEDIQNAEDLNLGKTIEDYQCVTLLKSVEAFDMSRQYYRAVPNLRDSLEFLLLNGDFPRSVSYNLAEVKKCLSKIKLDELEVNEGSEFFAGKLHANFAFLTIDEIQGDIKKFLEKTLNDIYKLGSLVINGMS